MDWVEERKEDELLQNNKVERSFILEEAWVCGATDFQADHSEVGERNVA